MSVDIAALMIALLFVFILLGVHISFSLALLCSLGIMLITGNFATGVFILGSTTFEAIRQFTFTAFPFFIMMGAFMSNSNIAETVFGFLARRLRNVPGGLGVATILANAFFSCVVGIAIAGAVIFTRVAVPELVKSHYSAKFSVGLIGGTSTLGMLIPPSLTLILYGTLAEVSIGRMFVAGIIPGIILVIMYSIYVVLMVVFAPHKVFVEGYTREKVAEILEASAKELDSKKAAACVISTAGLIVLIIGGIWGGFFSPTEAAAFGALGALIISIPNGMGIKRLKKALLETAQTVSAILFLLITAQMYSRMLTMSGLIMWVNTQVSGLDVHPYVILGVCLFIVLLTGTVIDVSSTILITVPLVVPIMARLGFDLIWFGIVFILFVHMGLLTPPFGINVFAIKSSLPANVDVKLEQIFLATIPWLGIMLVHAIIIIAFPILATWLPSLM